MKNNCKKLLIELNQICNLNCTYCFYRDYGRVDNILNLQDVKNIIKEFPNANEFYLTGGECFLSNEIDSIVDYLSKIGKVIIFTNGTLLNKYTDSMLRKLLIQVERINITFDSFDIQYECRNRIMDTLKIIKRIVSEDSSKLEVKVCINKFNYKDLDNIFHKLIGLGVKNLSVNFIFDIKCSLIKHEITDKKEMLNIFKIINKYSRYFNQKYVEVLKEVYLKRKKPDKFPCLADNGFYYINCLGKTLICPENKKELGKRGEWKECFSRECVNEWEMFY